MVGSKMFGKNMIYLISLIIIFQPLVLGAFASQTNWVTLISLKDTTGNAGVLESQPLIAGHSYNATLEIDIPFNQTSSTFSVSLNNTMTSAGPQYWYLMTKNYRGLVPSLYTPSEKVIMFKQIEGKIKLAVIFSIPATITIEQAEGFTFRFIKNNYPLVIVKVSGGSIVGEYTPNISDSAIENYLALARQKANLIPNGLIDKSYTPILNSTLTQANAIYKMGMPEKAINILNIIDPSSFPVTPSYSLQMALIIGLIVIAIIAVVGFVMYTRANSKTALKTSIIDSTRNELADIEVTAARYDEALAGRLRNLREKIGEEA
jgi:hypothetical protein